MSKKILFISANPHGAQLLKSDEEFSKINNIILSTRLKRLYEFKMLRNADRDNITQIIKEQPCILHFSLHGSMAGGIFVINGKTNSKNKKLAFAIGEEGIARIFRNTPSIKFMFINACYSDRIIEHTKGFLEYAIGFKGRIPDSTAIEFAERFYSNFAGSATIFHAYNMTKDEMFIKKELDFNPIFHSRRCLIMKEIAELKGNRQKLDSLKQKYRDEYQLSEQVLSEIEALEKNIRTIYLKHDSARVKVLLKNPFFEIVDWFHEKKKELAISVSEVILRRKEEHLKKKFAFDLDMLFDSLDYLLTSYDYKKINKERINKIPRLSKQLYIDALDELLILIPQENKNQLSYFEDNIEHLKHILSGEVRSVLPS